MQINKDRKINKEHRPERQENNKKHDKVSEVSLIWNNYRQRMTLLSL